MNISEKVWWRWRAALLDPRAYELVIGADIIVPSGETWFALEMWGYRDGAGQRAVYQRTPDAREMLVLPAGTVITADTSSPFASVHAYLCKPSSVTQTDPRYDSGRGCKDLFYERLLRLSQLPLSNLSIQVPATTPFGESVSTPFPTDFSSAMLMQASVFDVSWILLNDASGTSPINLWNEVSDDHQQRAGRVLHVPFQRAVFPSIKARCATVSGKDDGVIAGVGNVFYTKLPSDW